MRRTYNLKKMKEEIIEKYSGIPDKQIAVGVYLKSVGRKYVTIINTWVGQKTIQKELIEKFWYDHC
jgi:hypothetical protein